LEERGEVSVTELASDLGVSQNTIRNDLDTLAEQGLVARTHGGATIARAVLPSPLRPQATFLSPNERDKATCIADYAVSWIRDGDSLILDDSGLCVLMAERMAHFSRLRVITNSLAIAYVLAQEPSNTVVIAGGEFDYASLSTHGSIAQATLKDLRADKAFFSCTGVSPQSGLTEMSTENAQIKKRIKDAADSAFVLIESDRVGKIDLFPVASLGEPQRIVTDERIDLSDAEALVEKGARVTVCGSSGHQTYRPKPSGEKPVRIGFANLSDSIWFAQEVRAGLERAARQVGQVELFIVDNQNSVEIAGRNAADLLKQEIDLLIEYDGTGAAGRLVMRMTHLADVPVVAIDIPIVGATYFGCNHDAVGVAAGQHLGHWIQERWAGNVDEVMLVTCTGGGDKKGNGAMRIEDWTGGALPSLLVPAMRLDAALDTLQTLVHPQFRVRRLAAPGDWRTSLEAVTMFTALFVQALQAVPTDHHIAAVCLLNELALGLAQAARQTGREDRFVIVSFGHPDAATRAELSHPQPCLLGIVDLHPERYGERLLEVCQRRINGGAVPPAVFVEHSFLPNTALAGRP
jgi:DeoR/GlpR family transcriptional regulator of sugar metabolism/ABC-type sugar transport system substrate-binding protein